MWLLASSLLSTIAVAGGALKCDLYPLLPSEDPRHALYARPERSFPIQENAFGTGEIAKELRDTFAPTFVDRGIGVSTAEYERKAREFAADVADRRGVVFNDASGSLRLKIHLSTGELLITDKHGNVSAYLRLPIGEHPLGLLQHMHEVANALTSVVSYESEETGRATKYRRLTAAEALESSGFRSSEGRVNHFTKHVLGLKLNQSLAAMLQSSRPGRGGEFAAMRNAFLEEWKRIKSDPVAEKQLIAKYSADYEAVAQAFLKSDSPHVLTYTRVEDDPTRPGKKHPISIRFNPLTNEFAAIDRKSRRLLTYFRVDPSMNAPNEHLRHLGFPPVGTPFEYFLAIATTPARVNAP